MSGEPGRSEAVQALAAFVTGGEAGDLATRLGAGHTATQALSVVAGPRRERVRALLDEAGLLTDRVVAQLVLEGIAGAHAHQSAVTPVWTTPDGLARRGRLTASIHHYVSRARESVVCSTYNFQRSSALWTVLREVSTRPEVSVRIYVDTNAADAAPAPWKPTTSQVASEMAGATVLRTAERDGVRVVNHAKFVAVDHQVLLVTSANFSRSAERSNVELGLVLEHPLLTQQVERDMAALEAAVYEVVRRS